MSKTITIPKHNNPFIVNINNREFIYRGGDTIEVPDEVADAIANALALEPKPKKYLSKFAQRVSGTLTEIAANDLEGVETIMDSAFRGCSSITSIEIHDNVKSIKQNAFLSCVNAKTIRFGGNSNLERIEANAFTWCSLLTSVYLPKTPPVLADGNAFANIKADCVFYCKTQESLNAYKVAPNWSTLTGTYTFVVKE